MKEFKKSRGPNNWSSSGILILAEKNNTSWGKVQGIPEPIYGLGCDNSEYYQHILSYKNGFAEEHAIGKCWESSLSTNTIDFRNNRLFELTLDEYVNLAKKDLENLKAKIQTQDEIGAVYASKHHYLNAIIEFLKENHEGNTLERKITPKYPETNVFVISPNTTGHPLRTSIIPETTPLISFQIIADKKYSPAEAAIIATQVFGEKFGGLRRVRSGGTVFDSDNGGVMNLAYFAHEVPDYALQWIKNPVVMELSNYDFQNNKKIR